MSKLYTMKIAGIFLQTTILYCNYGAHLLGCLKEYTPLVPKNRCKTRWSADFVMISRYFELREFLPTVVQEFPDLADHCLSITEEIKLKTIHDAMKNFQEVTLALQKRDITIGEVII